MAQAICCGTCSWPIPEEFWNRPEAVRCRGCGTSVRATVFPAIANLRSGAMPEAITVDSEASCFYHPTSRAAIPCDECGRFLCRLCEIEIENRHLCPACFEAGVATRKLETVETRRTMYDSIALACATLPALMLWPVIIGAPAALWIVIRRWNAPRSIAPRTRIRFYLAALFAVAEIVGVIALIWGVRQISPRAGPR